MTPIKLFQGYSSTTGAYHSTAVIGESKIEGAQREVTYTLCKGLKSLMTTIDVKQSLDIDVIALGSINEKLKFLMKLNTTETTLAIVVHARKVEGREAQTNVRLASNIVVPISDIRDFFFHHGDAYVSSITTGGEYIAVLSFHTETESERTNLELELKGKGLFMFGSANFGLQEKVVESFQTKISFNQMILGLEDSYELPKFEEIIEFARKFPSMKLTAPKILAFETTGYEHVVGVHNGFNPIASNRNKLVGMGFRDLGLVGKFSKVCQLIDQIEEIQSIYNFYGGYNDPKLNEVAVLATKDLVTLQRIFHTFHSNPTIEVIIPPLPSLSKGTPQIQYKIDYSPEFGTRGKIEPKSTFDLFTGVDEYIKNKTRIVGIQLRTLSRLSNMTVDFVSSVGRRTEIYGVEEGAWHSRLALGDQDFIKKIVVKSNRDVDGLGIFVDFNRWIFAEGDDDSDNGTEHTFHLWDGMFVLGFRGFHSFKKFDTIQVIHAAFQPAKWRNGSIDVVNP
ncbi:hypothetical protein CsatB_015586 [Cannabis sativa]